jgi:hypothetical protein
MNDAEMFKQPKWIAKRAKQAVWGTETAAGGKQHKRWMQNGLLVPPCKYCESAARTTHGLKTTSVAILSPNRSSVRTSFCNADLYDEEIL